MILRTALINSIIFNAIVILISCNERPLKIEPRLVHTIGQLSDSTFFTDISNIDVYNNSFIVSDKGRGQFFELDQDLKLIKTFGVSGDGPGEINGLLRFAANGKKIYVANDGKRTLEIFEYPESTPSTSWRLPDEIKSAPLEYRFIVNNQQAYLAASDAGFPIAVFNDKGIINTFGRMIDYGNPTQNIIRNNRFLCALNNDYLVAIPDSYPVLEIYDYKGNLVGEQSIADYQPILERQYFIEQQAPEGDNVYYRLFRDVYYDRESSTLHLLCIGGKETPICNQIISFEFKKDRFEPLGLINLPGVWYASICISDNKILAYETRDDILQFFKY